MRPKEKALQVPILFATLLSLLTPLTECKYFLEFFCTPKGSLENPSLRVSGSGSNPSRTFIAENYLGDEHGLWAIDESTGEQGFFDDERSCFWKHDDNEYVWQSRKFQDRQVRRKRKRQGWIQKNW